MHSQYARNSFPILVYYGMHNSWLKNYSNLSNNIYKTD